MRSIWSFVVIGLVAIAAVYIAKTYTPLKTYL